MSINIIGRGANQVPVNGDLGSMAWQDHDPLVSTRSINAVVAASNTKILDQFALNQYRTVKYVIQATYSSVVYASEILLTHDNTYVYFTEFARLTNQAPSLLTTFDAVIVDGCINFRFTNSVGQAVTVTVSRVAINS